MANRKRMIVALVVLFGGMMLTGCASSSYSKLENKVFNEVNKLSKSIPEGFEEDRGKDGTEGYYTYTSPKSLFLAKGNYIQIRLEYDRSLSVYCQHFNTDMAKQYQEDFDCLPCEFPCETDTEFTVKSDKELNFFFYEASHFQAFIIRSKTKLKEGTIPKPKDNVIFEQKEGDIYKIELISYIRKKEDIFWNMHINLGSEYDKLLNTPGMPVPQKHVQRYIDLVERFIETFPPFPPRKTDFFNAVRTGSLEKIESLVENHPQWAKTMVGGNVEGGMTLLHSAVDAGQKEIAELLIAKGADVNAKFKGYQVLYHEGKAVEDTWLFGGYTPLHFAIYINNKDMAELLITNKANINARDENGATPLHIAVKKDYKDIAKLLIDMGPDVNAKNNKGRTPLILAARGGFTDIAQLLIDKGANIKVKDPNDNTALHYAAWQGHTDVVKILIEKGSEVNTKNNSGTTPLKYAAGYDHKETADFLLKHGGSIGTEIEDAIFQANLDNVKSLLKKNQELVNVADDSWKWTPLFWAVKTEHKDIAKFLIEKGADVNAKDTSGFTPLHRSIGNKDILKLLCKNSASVGSEIHDAVVQGKLEKVKSLLYENPQLINSKDSAFESTPLIWAARLGHNDIAEHLIANGAGVNVKGKWGSAPLHQAARAGQTALAELLLEKEAEINAVDGDGQTPLHRAAYRGKTEVFELLIDKGADVSTKDKDGKTPLDLAIEKGHNEIIDLLKKHGAVE